MPVISKPFFVLPADLGTIVCDDADPGCPVHSLNQHKHIGTTWKTEGTGDHWVRGQFAETTSIDFCAFIAANAVAGTQIRLRLGTSQAEVNGESAPYDSGVIDFIATTPSPAPDDGLYHSHLELDAVEDATWWRIDISGHTGVFEASMLVLGKKVQSGRYYDSDFSQGAVDLGDLEISPWGVADEEDGLVLRSLDFTLSWVTETEFETDFRPMMKRLGKRGVVYCCFDPTDSAWRQARTYMGWLRKPLLAAGVKKPRTVAQDFSILSFI